MAESIRYVVVCTCTGDVRALAYLDDDRPVGGDLVLDGAPGVGGQINIGAQHLDGSSAQNWIASTWGTEQFSENHAENGNVSWVVRCGEGRCPHQAQLTPRTLRRVAEVLVAKLDADPESLPAVPVDADETRHMVLLIDVVRYLSRKLV